MFVVPHAEIDSPWISDISAVTSFTPLFIIHCILLLVLWCITFQSVHFLEIYNICKVLGTTNVNELLCEITFPCLAVE